MKIEIPMDEYRFEISRLAAEREGMTIAGVVDSFLRQSGSIYLLCVPEVASTPAAPEPIPKPKETK